MLGLRKINGSQIDLWCGDPADFVTESRLVFSTLPDYFLDALNHVILSQSGRHCGIEIKQNAAELQKTDLKQVFSSLETFTKKEGQPLRRLTFIFSDLDAYKAFQKAFFLYFPDQFSE
jgi:hypothetical protein